MTKDLNTLEDFDNLEEFSVAEENYIKNIFSLSHNREENINPSELAKRLNVKSASITNMLKKLQKTGLIEYEPYRGVRLKKRGKNLALLLLRRHRLWESFLYDKLKFDWKQVHEIAEQLEHIRSPLLINRLEEFLGNPKFDPHGDPIPDRNGKIDFDRDLVNLNEVIEIGKKVQIVQVLEESHSLYKYLEQANLTIGTVITIKKVNTFDNSLVASDEDGQDFFLSEKITKLLLVKYV